MDNLIETLAFFVIIVLYGAASLFKAIREKTQGGSETQEPSEQSYSPAESRQMERQQTRQTGSPYQRPVQPRQPEAKQPHPKSQPQKESPWMKMLRELMDVDEEQPQPQETVVLERPIPKSAPPRPKKKPKKTEEPSLKVQRPVPVLKRGSYGRSYVFNTLAQQAQKRPLRSAIIYSEILRKPLALRRGPRRHAN